MVRFVKSISLFAVLMLRFAAQSQAPVEHPLPTNPKTSPDDMTQAALRTLPPDFKLMDSDGKLFDLHKTKGKVVIVNFWATWCGGCKYELPWFVEFDGKYRPKGLTAIGISMDDEGFRIAKPYLAAKHITYPSVIGNDALAKQFGLSGMPFTVLMDRQGRIAIAHAGVIDKQDFENHIQQLLQTPRK